MFHLLLTDAYPHKFDDVEMQRFEKVDREWYSDACIDNTLKMMLIFQPTERITISEMLELSPGLADYVEEA